MNNSSKNISTAKKRTLAAALVLMTFGATACSTEQSGGSWSEFEACARSYGWENIGVVQSMIEEYRANGKAYFPVEVACERVMP